MTVLPPKLFFATAALMAVAHFVLPFGSAAPVVVRLLGAPLFVFGAWANGAAAAQIHRAGTTIKPFGEPSELLSDGLFGWSRNPVYVGFVAMLLGIALMLGEIAPLLLAVGYGVILDRVYIRHEEAAMARIFGAAFDAYRAKVRRWL